MTTELHSLADTYIRSTNNHEPATFLGLFADNALVDDNFRGDSWTSRDSGME